MKLWEAVLVTVVAAMCLAVPIGAGMLGLSLLRSVIAGLMICMPAIVIGAGLWWLAQRSATEQIPSSTRTAVLGGILSGAAYLALVMRAGESLPATDGATLAAALWTMYTLPVVLGIGAAFGAGWGQRE